MKRNAINAAIIVSLLATLSSKGLAAQTGATSGKSANITNQTRSASSKSPSQVKPISKNTTQPTKTQAVKATSSSSSGSSTTENMPALPKIITMKMALQSSSYSQSFQVGQIALSIPEFYASSDDAIVFIDNNTHNYYYSLEQLTHMCGGKVVKEPNGDSKYVFSGDASIEVNASCTQATIFSNNSELTLNLSAQNSIYFDNTLYVTNAVLGALFDISSSLSMLEADFAPNFSGLKQENAIHDMAIQNYQQSQQAKDETIDVDAKPALFGLGRTQLYYNAVSKATGSLNYNYYAPLLWGTFVSSGTTGTQPFFTTAYLQYNLKDNNILALGKNIYTSQYTYTPIYGNFNGVYFGKSNITNVGYGTIDISGQASNGDRVELYRSGTLLDFQYAQGGRYDFIDVKLSSPRDVFVVRVYRPDNTFTEYTTSAYSGLGFLKEGESSVTGSVGQTYYNTTNTPAHSLEYTYGITSDLTASVSQSQGPLNTGVSSSLYYKNTFLIPNYTIGQYSYFNDNLSRASLNQYLMFTDNFQMNYGYLYSNLYNTNAATTTFYYQQGSINYNLNLTGNYVGSQNYSETLSIGQNLLSNFYNTINAGLIQQLGGQYGSTLGDQLSIYLLSRVNLIGGTTYYSTTKTASENIQLLYTDPNYSCSYQFTQDNQHNQVSTVSISIPIGIGFLDSISASASSNATQAVGAGKNIILSSPFTPANGMASNGWLYGHVQNEDGTPYKGGTIIVAGQTFTVDSKGNYFVPNITANTRTKIELSGISSDSHYGIPNNEEYIRVPMAQGLQLNFTLSELRNIFGMIQAPSDVMKNIQVQLLENNKVVQTSLLDYSGTYAFNNLPGSDYTIHILLPQGYSLSSNNIKVEFTPTSDWVTIENPVIVQKEV